MKERFWIESDKELMLQILNLNNIPSFELIEPNQSKFPIIGRKYGQHGGTDIFMLHTKEEVLNREYDFYTKFYSIEKEYCIEVDGLSVRGIEEAKVKHATFNEFPIRTEAYGWEFRKVDEKTVPEEWLSIAIRALYVTGIVHGIVKMGVLSNGSVLVIDIDPIRKEEIIEQCSSPLLFTIGADIEFMLSCNQELLPSSTFFTVDGDVGCDERQIEKDSGEYALVEIRPEQGDTPEELYTNIERVLEKASDMVPYENIEFFAGSMPFRGYQCGGHLHFGIPTSLSLLRALDYYLAIPISIIEEPKAAKLRRRTNHGGLGRFRKKSYGFEYLSLSSWIIEPKLTKSIICLAYLVAAHHEQLQNDLLFHPAIQRAYYHANIPILKKCWNEIKIQIMETSSFQKFEKELNYLFETIEKGRNFSENSDIRKNWNLKVPPQLFDTGFSIQIPKKMRQKYKLKEGSTAFVSAGKRLSLAKIHAYPFAFQNSNIVQLSEALRAKLLLPVEWNPRLKAHNGVILLGPVIGILATKPFYRQTTYFQHLFRLAQEKQILVYVFEPSDIDWENQVINGISHSGEGVFPFPAVIYDRYLMKENTNIMYDIEEVRTKLQTIYNIPFLNPPALSKLTGNKWSTHQLLVKEYEEYLPQTKLIEQLNDVKTMLNQHGEIFLKPLDGSLSQGVIRVVQTPSEIIMFHKGNNQQTCYFSHVEDLLLQLSALIQSTPYLVQEGIRRKKFQDKNVEVRVYMQKNEKGIWLRTGMVTRLTSEGVMTEDLEVNMRLSVVMNELYEDPNDRRNMTNQLGKIARNIVATVEEEVGVFGEIAVDLCIDHCDSIKLLEINSKPDNLFSQIKAYKLRSLAGNRLLNYAASLAGYHD